jgi:hypothetical protein
MAAAQRRLRFIEFIIFLIMKAGRAGARPYRLPSAPEIEEQKLELSLTRS